MAMVKTNDLEVTRVAIPAGREIPMHRAPGEITVQCLEGLVLFIAHGKSQRLGAGQFLYLADGEPYAIIGLDDAVLLVTIQVAKENADGRAWFG